MFLDVELTDRKQNVLARLDNRQPGLKWDGGLNKGRTCAVPISLHEPAREMAEAMKTLLRVTLRGPDDFSRCLMIGRVLIPVEHSEAGTEQLQLTAVDPFQHFNSLLLRKIEASIYNAVTFKGIDQSQIMWQLIEAREDANHGVVKGTLAAASKSRDRTYPPGKELGLAIQQMSEVIDGPDFELEPIPGQGTDTIAEFNTFYPKLGSDLTDVVFIHSREPDTASAFETSEAGDALGNRVLAIGAPQSEPTEENPVGIYPGYVAEHAASIAEYDAFEKLLKLEDVVETSTLEAHAKALVAAGAFPPLIFDYTIAPEQWEDQSGPGVPPVFGRDYWFGDTVTGESYGGGAEEPIVATGRITDASLTELPNGQLQVKLAATPTLSSAGVTGKAVTVRIPESP